LSFSSAAFWLLHSLLELDLVRTLSVRLVVLLAPLDAPVALEEATVRLPPGHELLRAEHELLGAEHPHVVSKVVTCERVRVGIRMRITGG
jgi:hypothetical protein